MCEPGFYFTLRYPEIHPPSHCFRNFSFEKAQVCLSSLYSFSFMLVVQVVLLNQTLSTSSFFPLLLHSAPQEFATRFLLELQELQSPDVAWSSSWGWQQWNASLSVPRVSLAASAPPAPQPSPLTGTTIYFCTDGKTHWKINGVLSALQLFPWRDGAGRELLSGSLPMNNCKEESAAPTANPRVERGGRGCVVHKPWCLHLPLIQGKGKKKRSNIAFHRQETVPNHVTLCTVMVLKDDSSELVKLAITFA